MFEDCENKTNLQDTWVHEKMLAKEELEVRLCLRMGSESDPFVFTLRLDGTGNFCDETYGETVAISHDFTADEISALKTLETAYYDTDDSEYSLPESHYSTKIKERLQRMFCEHNERLSNPVGENGNDEDEQDNTEIGTFEEFEETMGCVVITAINELNMGTHDEEGNEYTMVLNLQEDPDGDDETSVPPEITDLLDNVVRIFNPTFAGKWEYVDENDGRITSTVRKDNSIVYLNSLVSRYFDDQPSRLKLSAKKRLKTLLETYGDKKALACLEKTFPEKRETVKNDDVPEHGKDRPKA